MYIVLNIVGLSGQHTCLQELLELNLGLMTGYVVPSL
jgi:hypothetical protein